VVQVQTTVQVQTKGPNAQNVNSCFNSECLVIVLCCANLDDVVFGLMGILGRYRLFICPLVVEVLADLNTSVFPLTMVFKSA
jgi:hypothetical protein